MCEFSLGQTISTICPSHLRRHWHQIRKLIKVVHLSGEKHTEYSIETKVSSLKFYGKRITFIVLRRDNLPLSPQRLPPTASRSASNRPLTSIPLPQPEPIGIHIRHGPRLTAVSRDPKSQHNGRLANQLVQIQQPGLSIHRQLKRPDQTPRHRLDVVERGNAVARNRQVDAEHVDLALALVREHVGRVEVELEAKGARAGAGEAGEVDNEVLRIGVARSFLDHEVEGVAGGIDGIGTQGVGEVVGPVRLVRVDCVRRGGCKDLAGDAASALLGGGE